jgi:hypothetical protein
VFTCDVTEQPVGEPVAVPCGEHALGRFAASAQAVSKTVVNRDDLGALRECAGVGDQQVVVGEPVLG